MNIEHLSYSSISMFLDCPEAWRRKYIAKEPTKTTTALAFGKAFHATIERMIDPAGEKPEWLITWNAAFDENVNDQVEFDLGETSESLYNEGVRILSDSKVQSTILSILPAVDTDGAMIERKVELRVPGVPVPIIGYIDVVLEDGTPADFKTSSRSWSDSQAGGSLQTLFYLAALNQAGFTANWRFKHIVFVKTKTPQVQVLEHSHKPAELFFSLRGDQAGVGWNQQGGISAEPDDLALRGQILRFLG